MAERVYPVRVNFRLTQEQATRLAAIAKRTHRTEAGLVRYWIDATWSILQGEAVSGFAVLMAMAGEGVTDWFEAQKRQHAEELAEYERLAARQQEGRG